MLHHVCVFVRRFREGKKENAKEEIILEGHPHMGAQERSQRQLATFAGDKAEYKQTNLGKGQVVKDSSLDCFNFHRGIKSKAIGNLHK